MSEMRELFTPNSTRPLALHLLHHQGRAPMFQTSNLHQILPPIIRRTGTSPKSLRSLAPYWRKPPILNPKHVCEQHLTRSPGNGSVPSLAHHWGYESMIIPSGWLWAFALASLCVIPTNVALVEQRLIT